jgi:SAM-dependent methyltransferase
MLAQVKRAASERGLHNIVAQQGAAEQLPFANGAFDIVLSRFSAHHWRDMEAGLREARRVLKKAGRAVFADVAAPAHPLLDTHLQTLELLRDPSHVRNYNVGEWIAALGRAGFSATGLTARKLRMEFPVWVERTKTPEPYRTALRMLQAKASQAVRDHFAIDDDGSFDLDALTIEAATSFNPSTPRRLRCPGPSPASWPAARRGRRCEGRRCGCGSCAALRSESRETERPGAARGWRAPRE